MGGVPGGRVEDGRRGRRGVWGFVESDRGLTVVGVNEGLFYSDPKRVGRYRGPWGCGFQVSHSGSAVVGVPGGCVSTAPPRIGLCSGPAGAVFNLSTLDRPE